MPTDTFAQLIDPIRTASRHLVRELGFMGGHFAGTELAPSAVHALIEIETGGVTARDLAARLQLEKSSVSRMLRKLVDAQDVIEQTGDDGRMKLLSLTDQGRRRVAAIHGFARRQVSEALHRLQPAQAREVLNGLTLYAAALAPSAQPPEPPAVTVESGYRTGLIARIIALHAHYYAHNSGFGQYFETVVAAGLAAFSNRLGSPKNAIWAAVQGNDIVGSIAIDGQDLGDNIAHLRWFIVDDATRGSGAGRMLLQSALAFADAQGFAETHLWTFSGLNAARHLYEAHGFVLAQEQPGGQWGREVMEQQFVRPKPL